MTRRLDETPAPDHTPPDRLELAEWRERFGVVAGITTAVAGNDFRLGTATSTESTRPPWPAFLDAMRGEFRRFRIARQVHGDCVLEHHPGAGRDASAALTVADAADGHVTTDAGTLLLVTAADCVPVYIIHPATRTIALVHAGWRGVAAGIVERGIARVSRLGEAPARDIVIHCGVSICGSCYEVGPEVVAAVAGVAPPADPTYLDLRGAIGRRAAAAGVHHVSVSGWCTAHDGDHFYSHRRSHGRDGRMVAYLGVPAP